MKTLFIDYNVLIHIQSQFTNQLKQLFNQAFNNNDLN